MLKELNEDLKNIKKIQPEMKSTLIEIRKIYRETTIEWMKLRIESMIWNIRKQKNQPTITTTTTKNNQKE